MLDEKVEILNPIYYYFEFDNPISGSTDRLKIFRMPVNRMHLNTMLKYEDDDDIRIKLNAILKDFNISRLFNGNLPYHTDTPRYISMLSEYFFYTEKLTNPIEWNYWFDILIKAHIFNIVFEKQFIPPIENKPKGKRSKNSKPLPPNRFIKTQTFDLFSHDIIYEYVNLRTGETIKSDNPDLVNKLNAQLEENNKRKIKGERKARNAEKARAAKPVKLDANKVKFNFKIKL